jgi:copper chaperone NosL
MSKKLNITLIVLTMTIAMSCSVEPQPINYGSDACEFCKMTIVENRWAAEIVTKKGKAYKYDAIECMMNYMNRNDISTESLALLLVDDYTQPGNLIDAIQATYIKSEAIPSPMGAFLSAFSKKDDAEETVADKGGEVFDFEVLKTRYQVK